MNPAFAPRTRATRNPILTHNIIFMCFHLISALYHRCFTRKPINFDLSSLCFLLHYRLTVCLFRLLIKNNILNINVLNRHIALVEQFNLIHLLLKPCLLHQFTLNITVRIADILILLLFPRLNRSIICLNLQLSGRHKSPTRCPIQNIILIRLHKHRRLNLNQLSIRPLQLHLPQPLIILNNLRLQRTPIRQRKCIPHAVYNTSKQHN